MSEFNTDILSVRQLRHRKERDVECNETILCEPWGKWSLARRHLLGACDREELRHQRKQTGLDSLMRRGCRNRKPELGTRPPGALRKVGVSE